LCTFRDHLIIQRDLALFSVCLFKNQVAFTVHVVQDTSLFMLHSIAILIPPVSVKLGLGQGFAVLTCRIRGEYLLWRVDGEGHGVTGFGRGISPNNTKRFDGDKLASRIMVPATQRNNGTEVVCRALDGSYTDSAPATVFVTSECTFLKVHRTTTINPRCICKGYSSRLPDQCVCVC